MSNLREEQIFDEIREKNGADGIRNALRCVFNDNLHLALPHIKLLAVERVSPLITAFENTHHFGDQRSPDQIVELICGAMDQLEGKGVCEQETVEDPFEGDFHDNDVIASEVHFPAPAA